MSDPTRADLKRMRDKHHPDCVHQSGAVPETFPCPCTEIWRLIALIEELARVILENPNHTWYGEDGSGPCQCARCCRARALLPDDECTCDACDQETE